MVWLKYNLYIQMGISVSLHVLPYIIIYYDEFKIYLEIAILS